MLSAASFVFLAVRTMSAGPHDDDFQSEIIRPMAGRGSATEAVARVLPGSS
ncbi:hypothetical protein ACF08N_16765 [Streptomyces sp. NPDC015127]|uniref:hypothetical protein n=1 Tax=Streptomyces sp. NPDC015127 TaxID=3364939 RepID=UPI0036F99AB5